MRLLLNSLLIFSFVFIAACGSKEQTNSNVAKEVDSNSSDPILFALNKAVKDDPENQKVLFRRASYLLEKGKPHKALNDILKLVEHDESNYEYNYLLSQAYLDVNDYRKALKYGKVAEELQPSHAGIHILISRIYIGMGEINKASFYSDIAMKMAPGHSDIFLLKGMEALFKGDTVLGLQNFRNGLVKDPGNVSIYKEMVKYFSGKQQKDSSMIYLIAGQKLAPVDPFFHYYKGLILDLANLNESALASYKAALEIDPDYYPAGFKLGEYFYSNEDIDKSLSYLVNLIKRDTADAKVSKMLGDIYEKKKNNREAIIFYKKVLENEPSDNFAKESLTRLYAAYPEFLPTLVKKEVDSLDNKVLAHEPISEVPPKVMAEKPAVEPKKETVKQPGLDKVKTVKPDSVRLKKDTSVIVTTPQEKPEVEVEAPVEAPAQEVKPYVEPEEEALEEEKKKKRNKKK